jgi:SAM-dependent methyltransferase
MNNLKNCFDFELDSSINMIDLGCGNGYFINNFISYIKPIVISSCIGIDPYIEWLSVADKQPNITNTLCISSKDFSNKQINYTHLLMKEMIHHIDNLTEFFCNIHKQLLYNGKIIIITRPVHTNYPFFNRINELWKIIQIPYEDIVNCIKKAGFNVNVEIKTLPINVTKKDWLTFIKNKTWSTFSMCTEKELNDGLYTLDIELDNNITFNEILIFIIATPINKN